MRTSLVYLFICYSVHDVCGFNAASLSRKPPILRHASPGSAFEDTEELNDTNQQRDLLEKARSLRKEAEVLEQKLRENRADTVSQVGTSKINNPVVQVTNLENSIWAISYRFSSQPKNDNDDSILKNYSGKLQIRLTPDGYSDLLSTPESNGDEELKIMKVWGWDEEFSREDKKQYLLFSMDVLFPKSDPKLANQVERCYFQARIERDAKDNSITLKDGTVTVKKDVSEKTKGMWGLFQVAGILTEFRYVGDFIAKPST